MGFISTDALRWHRSLHLQAGCHQILTLLATDPEYGAFDMDSETARTHAVIDGLALHLIRQRLGEDTSRATSELAWHLDSLY